MKTSLGGVCSFRHISCTKFISGGGEMTNKISLGVGVIHQGKRFLRNCTHVQLVGNSLRYEDTKTRCLVKNPPTSACEIYVIYCKKSGNLCGRKSAKTGTTCQSGSSTHIVQFNILTRIYYFGWKKPTHPTLRIKEKVKKYGYVFWQ